MSRLTIGNRLVLENRFSEAVETITIKGDDAGLEEALLALRKGAVVVELNLVYHLDESEWRFTVKGESLAFSGLKTPETAPVTSREEVEAGILERVYLFDKLLRFMDRMFAYFIKLRLSENWEAEVVPQIKTWIYE